MKTRHAFTLVEYLAVALTIALFVGVLAQVCGVPRETKPHMQAGATLVPVATDGKIRLMSHGSEQAASLWVPINGQYLGSELLLSPDDSLTKWTGSTVTTANLSFAALPIEDGADASGQPTRQITR